MLNLPPNHRWEACIGLFLATALCVSGQPAIAHPGHGTFTQTLVHQTLTPQFRLLGLGIAFLFGMAHAMSPGHGKTMVAAYLVGTRGTPQQALLLGVITTLTHTLGIFLLGFAVLLAANYILPERFYPVLSGLSGLMVFGVGFWLLDQRLQALQATSAHRHDHAHAHSHAHSHVHSYTHGHPRGHAHLHTHGQADDHPPHDSHGAGVADVATPAVTWRSLLALGIAGGMVPCPSALVLLLSAIALQQTAYGMVLVSVFSLGLAVVLIGLGLLVIYAHQWLDRVAVPLGNQGPIGPHLGAIQRALPLASAIVVIVVGAGLTLSSVL